MARRLTVARLCTVAASSLLLLMSCAETTSPEAVCRNFYRHEDNAVRATMTERAYVRRCLKDKAYCSSTGVPCRDD